MVLSEDSEYRLPVSIQPRVILDIGANIGLTSLYFATAYPQARIWAFEPAPANLELLQGNVAAFSDRVTVIPVGLGAEAGRFPFGPSGDPLNFGGGSFRENGSDPSQTVLLPATTLRDAVERYSIPQPDVIKLDAEGAEWNILRGTPAHLLAATKVVIGELHGMHDWDVLAMLSKTHRIGVNKKWERSCYPFHALRNES